EIPVLRAVPVIDLVPGHALPDAEVLFGEIGFDLEVRAAGEGGGGFVGADQMAADPDGIGGQAAREGPDGGAVGGVAGQVDLAPDAGRIVGDDGRVAHPPPARDDGRGVGHGRTEATAARTATSAVCWTAPSTSPVKPPIWRRARPPRATAA